MQARLPELESLQTDLAGRSRRMNKQEEEYDDAARGVEHRCTMGMCLTRYLLRRRSPRGPVWMGMCLCLCGHGWRSQVAC